MKSTFLLFSVMMMCSVSPCIQATVATTQPPAVIKKNYIQQGTYGGEKGAEVFKVKSEYAIQWATHMIAFLVTRSHNENKPLRSYYAELIGAKDTGLAKFRRDIAFETDTQSKDVFGAFRIKDTPHLLDYTPIRKSWHDDVADCFVDLLAHLDKTDTDHIVHLRSARSSNDFHVVNQDHCLDDKNIPFSRDILINHYKYDPEELTDERVVKIAQHEAVSMDELFFGPPSADIKRDLRLLQRKKDELRILKYAMRLKVGDRMVPISVIYGLFQSDPNKSNGVTQTYIDKLSKKSHFIVMHTAKEYVETLMKLSEEFWEKAVLRQRTDVDGIKEDLANVFFIQTHAMPYSRGSEAITKWVIEAVARYHGWTLVYPEEYGFQSPFHTTIDDFVMDFVRRVTLVPYVGSQQVAPVNMIPAA